MMPAGTYALGVAIAAARMTMASSVWSQSYPLPLAPEVQEGRAWLDRKAADRERGFQAQQRQQAEERRDLRLERRLDADRRLSASAQNGRGNEAAHLLG